MCTTLIAQQAAQATGIDRFRKGKPLLGQDIVPRVKPPVPEPVKDLAGEERRARAKELKRTLAGRPGPGRAGTIKTGAGSPNLKQKAGQ